MFLNSFLLFVFFLSLQNPYSHEPEDGGRYNQDSLGHHFWMSDEPAEASPPKTKLLIGQWKSVKEKEEVTLSFEGEHLRLECGNGKFVIEADYSVTQDGIVYGIVTHAEDEEGVFAVLSVTDEPFRFRVWAHQDRLVVKDFRLVPHTAAAGRKLLRLEAKSEDKKVEEGLQEMEYDFLELCCRLNDIQLRRTKPQSP